MKKCSVMTILNWLDNSGEEINLINACSMKNVNKVVHNNLATVFPAIKIPVSSATRYCVFSKLKILKRRLRTMMTESRLEDLLIRCCERDTSEKISILNK